MDIDPDDNPFDKYNLSICYAIWSSYHQMHGYSPTQLVYGRDMLVDTATPVNWDQIKWMKQEKIRKSNKRKNASSIDYTYQLGNKILIEKPTIVWKLAIPFEGPYKVVRHSLTRGSITYKKIFKWKRNGKLAMSSSIL